MTTLAKLLLLVALVLPGVALAQPDDAGRRDGRGGAAGDDRRESRVTPEMVPEVLEMMRAAQGEGPEPPWLARVERVAADDPEAAARLLGRIPRVNEMLHAYRNHPDAFDLYVRQMRLMRQHLQLRREFERVRRGDNEEAIEQTRDQLRENIEAMFDTRIALERFRLSLMRERIERAEQRLEESVDSREQTVDEQMRAIEEGRRLRGDRDGAGPGDRPERDRPDREREHERERERPRGERGDRDRGNDDS